MTKDKTLPKRDLVMERQIGARTNIKADVRQTTDYAMFSYLAGNRQVTKYHVQRLINSFEANPTLIALRPVLVNEHFEIIDGQHRLQACQALQLPVHYVIFPGLTIETAQLMNSLQKSWTLADYAQSYALSGKKDYKIFAEYMQEYALPIGVLLLYIGGKDRRNTSRPFVQGEFKIEDRDLADIRLGMLSSFEKYASFWNQASFANAFWKVLKYPKYDHQRMLRGFAAQTARRQGSANEYLREFERMYNYQAGTGQVRFF